MLPPYDKLHVKHAGFREEKTLGLHDMEDSKKILEKMGRELPLAIARGFLLLRDDLLVFPQTEVFSPQA
jgi:hypothetical protein